MSPVKIKICGITSPEDALLCHGMGADFLGVIFADSPRRIAPEGAAAIRRAVPGARLVGVFMDAALDEIVRNALFAGLDMIQLHGSESAPFCAELHARTGLPIVKALAQGRLLDRDDPAAQIAPAHFLLDLDKTEPAGQKAIEALWSEAAEAANMGYELFLAGGLDPDNVRQAIRKARPFGVDVCRGVEKEPGIKDAAAVKRFIAEVKNGDE